MAPYRRGSLDAPSGPLSGSGCIRETGKKRGREDRMVTGIEIDELKEKIDRAIRSSW
jgi:hypothetical protein